MNNIHLLKAYCCLLLLVPFFSCTSLTSQKIEETRINAKEFKEYWYAGKAELTRYELEQARYGEIHDGEAVLIFVTEDFDTREQVKYEGEGDRKNVTSVLKLNATRKFFTGLYPYSMMTSVFTPVDYQKPTLKVTTTSQEWCGHTFSQLNLSNNKYKGRLFSYFQNEGDQEFTLDKALLEDEIWAKIRLNPGKLPTGKIQIIPGAMFLRLKHRPHGVEAATASLGPHTDASLSNRPLQKYTVAYDDFDRTLEIIFESEFPYAIVGWTEEVTSGFGASAKTLTTRARRTHSMNSAYWSQNDVKDAPLRKDLGLDARNY